MIKVKIMIKNNACYRKLFVNALLLVERTMPALIRSFIS